MIIRGDYSPLKIYKNGGEEYLLQLDQNSPSERVIFERNHKHPFIAEINQSFINEDPNKSALYSESEGKSILTLSLGENFDGILRPKTYRENTHLIRGIEIEHVSSRDKILPRHFERIDGKSCYSRRDLPEKAWHNYSALVQALIRFKI
ncbi:MAG: hypothetical protein Q7S27_01195 [Nanoarchaeota archaeon]|nr:hypothetical protein [Nanoarchaeota archaeon]